MKILTWNINGIRAVQRDKSGLKKLFDSLGADVICLQETKVTRDMLDEPTAIVEGYESFFGYSRKKTGYSGTANFCHVSCIPSKAEEGLTDRLTSQVDDAVEHYGDICHFTSEEIDAIDDEGRCVITLHKIRLPSGECKEVAIINVYVPRAGDREERLAYKLKFLTVLQLRAEALLRSGIHVIVLGDINTTHTNKDHCDPESNEEYIRRPSRIWLNQFLQVSERDPSIPETDARIAELVFDFHELKGGLFSDVFRRLHPDQENAFTNWCTLTGARQTNYGRRLDYILVDTKLAQFTKECNIMADVHGSDHCPVILTLDCSSIASSSIPSLCSRFMPEFRGQQKKLSSFFSKVSNTNSTEVFIGAGNKTVSSNSVVKASPSPAKKNLSSASISGPPPKKQHLMSKQQSGGKKTKLKKEDSKQISLNFFYHSKSRSNISSKESNIKDGQNKTEEKNMHEKDETSAIFKEQSDCLIVLDSPKQDTSEENSADLLSRTNPLISSSSDSSSLPPSNADSSSSPSKSDSSSLALSNDKTYTPSSSASASSSAKAWKNILGGLPPPPLCPGHKEPSVLRTVKKEGPNKNKQFYVCARPDGAPGNPLSRCDFFQWLNIKK